MLHEGTPTEPPSNALSVSPEQVAFIIVKARQFSAKVGATGLNDASDPADEQDGGVIILENMRHDPVLQELTDAIEGLAEDEQRDLIALLWIGRGEFDAEDWEEARRQADATEFSRGVSRYLLRDPLSGENLAEGMNRMGFDISDYGAAEHL